MSQKPRKEKTGEQTGAKQVQRRSEKEGIGRFTREMVSALLMALVAIIYVIQAFKIPTGSMERSLLIGDFLLGLKFVYGAPVLPLSYWKFPGIGEPKPGDVVIFEYPGVNNKDYIKRCVAGPGETVEIKKTRLLVNGKELVPPPKSQYTRNGRLGPGLSRFEPLRIPEAGDTLEPSRLPLREYVFARNLMVQENPRLRFVKFFESLPLIGQPPELHTDKERAQMAFQLQVNGRPANGAVVTIQEQQQLPLQVRTQKQFYAKQERIVGMASALYDRSPHISVQNALPTRNGLGVLVEYRGPFEEFPFHVIDNWTRLRNVLTQVEDQLADGNDSIEVEIVRTIQLDEETVEKYVVKNDNYFMMGDNRDNSADSRYWGYLNGNYVKAKAFILYFSLKPEMPLALLPIKIRWGRIGKLIRKWDGRGE
jgi:signal peptidase I